MIGDRVAQALPELRQQARSRMVPSSVKRKTSTPDGSGGSSVEWVTVGTVDAFLTRPNATERETAAQEGVEITHTAVMPQDAGDTVRRGDRLDVAGQTVELVSDPLTATAAVASRATAKQEPWDELTE